MLQQREVIVTATVTEVTDSVTPVTVFVIPSQLSPLGRSHCHPVTVAVTWSQLSPAAPSITAVRFRLFRLFRPLFHTLTACRPQPPIRVDNRNPVPLR